MGEHPSRVVGRSHQRTDMILMVMKMMRRRRITKMVSYSILLTLSTQTKKKKKKKDSTGNSCDVLNASALNILLLAPQVL